MKIFPHRKVTNPVIAIRMLRVVKKQAEDPHTGSKQEVSFRKNDLVVGELISGILGRGPIVLALSSGSKISFKNDEFQTVRELILKGKPENLVQLNRDMATL